MKSNIGKRFRLSIWTPRWHYHNGYQSSRIRDIRHGRSGAHRARQPRTFPAVPKRKRATT